MHRIAGQGQYVMQAERVRAQQIRLERHHVAVAGRHVQDGFQIEGIV